MKIDQILKLMVEKKASDLHLAVGELPMLRIDSRLFPAGNQPLEAQILQDMIHEIISAEQKQEFDREKELDFSYEIPNLNRFRFNLFWDRGGIGAAVRIISNKIPTTKEQKSACQLRAPLLVKVCSHQSRCFLPILIIDAGFNMIERDSALK